MAAAGRARTAIPLTAEQEGRVGQAARSSLDRMEAIAYVGVGGDRSGFRVCIRGGG
jgi:hypothetical protein